MTDYTTENVTDLIAEGRMRVEYEDHPDEWLGLIERLVDALEAAVKAHTPTGDERRIWMSLAESIVGENEGTAIPVPVEDIRTLLSGRSEVPEPGAEEWDAGLSDAHSTSYRQGWRAGRASALAQPQGEPTDSDLIAWHVEQIELLRPFRRSSTHLKAAIMHAATVRTLRAGQTRWLHSDTPASEERETLERFLSDLPAPIDRADAILAAGFRLHREPQGEPSDAQVEIAWRTYEKIPPETFVMGPAIGKARERMRAALRAAGGVR